MAISEFQDALSQKVNTKAVAMVTVLCELSLKDDAIKTYIDYVCKYLVSYDHCSGMDFGNNELMNESIVFQRVNENIMKVFSEEISS